MSALLTNVPFLLYMAFLLAAILYVGEATHWFNAERTLAELV